MIRAVTPVSSKILARDSVQDALRPLHDTASIVFTNGCFDILHAGHADLLARARAHGDILVVGVNADESIPRLKGPTRPLNALQDRLFVLASLECVDYVVPFTEDTPYTLIQDVQPNILIKGGDWSVENIVGRDIVEATGGTVLSLPLKPGFSTTGLIKKVLTTCTDEA
ncbi:D-glycero-beta-D-manno-heptose 1-phosphate adenylyltransferase [Desulfobaculum sp.]